MENISIIGSGNIAYAISKALAEKKTSLKYLYCRSLQKGIKLEHFLNSQQINIKFTENLADLLTSDLIILAVSDNALSEIIEKLRTILVKAKTTHFPTIVHCSGATPLSIFDTLRDFNIQYGVLYPLMTMSKYKEIDLKDVPFFIEGNNCSTEEKLAKMVEAFGSLHVICDSETRLKNHIAAVFSCNFTNYILELAFELGANNHTYLLPTTMEMIRKCFLYTPKDARTGPAARKDHLTITKHMELLQNMGFEEHLEVYKLLTNKILERNDG